jgi:chromosome segregation ATPase
MSEPDSAEEQRLWVLEEEKIEREYMIMYQLEELQAQLADTEARCAALVKEKAGLQATELAEIPAVEAAERELQQRIEKLQDKCAAISRNAEELEEALAGHENPTVKSAAKTS